MQNEIFRIFPTHISKSVFSLQFHKEQATLTKMAEHCRYQGEAADRIEDINAV